MNSTVFAIGGALIGSGITYLVLNETLKKKYADIADEEIASVKESYKTFRGENPSEALKSVDLEDLSNATDPEKKAFLDRMDELSYNTITPDENDIYTELEEEPFDPASVDVTIAVREPDVPYVIAVNEFFEDEEDFDKLTITWFDEDQTLVDERNQTMDVGSQVGLANMNKFGQGSGSPDTVYIRHEQLKIDFEVVRNHDSYSATILGIPEWDTRAIKADKKPKKMRTDD